VEETALCGGDGLLNHSMKPVGVLASTVTSDQI